MTELSTRYSPNENEDKWLKFWEEKNVFHAQANPDKKPYSIVIPPPNVTGILHMGHALNNTLQDILIRYKRMTGFETLWMPGIDHAGIATQNVVEKQIAKEGKTRQDLGREEFLKRLWEWKKQYGDTIIRQLEKLGASCDWQRTRFTMDEHYSEAVRHTFITLYEKGLIYRGQRIINWCPRCQTALSDEEAQHKEINGSLYYIRYSFKENPHDSVTVATTRPETMLGDTAVAVNPTDKRYKKFIGKTLILPLVNREIKIIADELVDPKFGTGAVKVTPAHDPNDFAMGKKHDLEFINIMHPDARLNEKAGHFSGMSRAEGRKAVLEALKQGNLLEKIEPHTHAVGHCYRCDTMVEPYLSRQWFVKMKPLAQPAIDVVKKGKIKFYPSRWTKVYLNWMENIQDWCISRQIWWGHRIPVWYCRDCHNDNAPIVSKITPQECPQCHSKNIYQDEDVLDTWFSSWLWPFATLHWPEKNKDLEYFYPTSALSTAPEIIFFWVARMIMAGLEFMGDIPFSDVYIHGTVRDAKGRKMSKSLGNAIDPLEIIKEYGADALRFSLIMNSGQDLFISKEKFEIGRNFANKIWNASRLILMNIPEGENNFDLANLNNQKTLDLPSRWILAQFYATLEKVDKALDKYRFSEAETLIYDFFWGNFCDWYLETIKDKFSDKNTRIVAAGILEQTLKMLHPFMPFITEEIWHKFNPHAGSLAVAAWPTINKQLIDKKAQGQMKAITELINVIRNIRMHWNIDQHASVECFVQAKTENESDLIKENSGIIKILAKISNLSVERNLPKPKDAATGIAGKLKFYIPLAGVIDIEKEKGRITAQVKNQAAAVKDLSKRLKNKDFLKKAPKEVVEKERARLETLQAKIKELKTALKELF
ncbi:MAG TPA: valine--tRNA ligase [Candidatus Omnitrophota bacterium]|nr:valine--tRNA ligase [Candidatus Omnitrophota bacterium]HPD85226.1 valine--tRNA ligase [Candidatus Omnitrophota bacterium]HRZ04273.1 valine--tRNA ligase [Candidatus Omnitrophota bacterium]